MNNISPVRAAFLIEMRKRLEMAQADGSQIIMVEPWEFAMLLAPELARLQTLPDTDSTDRMDSIDLAAWAGHDECNAVTQESRVVGE